MTRATGVASACIVYDMHGVAIAVSAQEAVLATVDARLRAFDRADRRHDSPDLRIEFLECGELEDQRVGAPAGAGRPVYDTPHGQLLYFSETDVLFGELAGVRLRCEASHGIARIEAAAFSGLELYLATHPLLTIGLMELLERRARYSIHAACLAHDGQGVLLAGPSGAGKSTLALALASAGALAFLSDDVVFLDHRADGTVRALAFADTLGVTEGTAARIPDLRRALADPPVDGFPKRLVRVEDALAGVAVASSCAPRALIFPRVVPDESSALTALDPREAWLRLVPDVLLTEPAATQAHLAALAALLAQVRTYELRSGADLDRAARLVVEALAQ